MLTGLPSPFTSLPPIAPVRVPDIRLDVWAYRLLRSLQVNRSGGRLVHQPYYRPFSSISQGYTSPPFLSGADHYFKWCDSDHQYPLAVVNFSINPLYHFTSPRVIVTNHLLFGCPSIQILYWDCPQYLPIAAVELLFEQEEALSQNSVSFLNYLEEFCTSYYSPISPYNPSFSVSLCPDQPPSPPNIPNTPFFAIYNPNTIPLVQQQ